MQSHIIRSPTQYQLYTCATCLLMALYSPRRRDCNIWATFLSSETFHMLNFAHCSAQDFKVWKPEVGKTTKTKYREKLSRSCNSLLHGMESFAKAHTRFVTCKSIKLLMFTSCTKKKRRKTRFWSTGPPQTISILKFKRLYRPRTASAHVSVVRLALPKCWKVCRLGPGEARAGWFAKMIANLTLAVACQAQLTTLAFTNHGFSSNVQLYSKEVLLRDSRVTEMRFTNHWQLGRKSK